MYSIRAMAGILFTNNKVFLAGYKSFTGQITGIGGKQKIGETVFQTAIRETLEELLGVIPDDISAFEEMLNSKRKIENSGFTQFVCTFDELEMLLTISGSYYTSSPFYDKFPRTLNQLLLNRKNTDNAEISHLAILPFVINLKIANHIISDINCALTAASMK